MEKFLSVLLCLCTLCSFMPTGAFAAYEDGLCQHHTAHDPAVCGWADAVYCTHEHTAECYQQIQSCIHDHTVEGCTYVAAQEAKYCGHICGNGTCSYDVGFAGQSCSCDQLDEAGNKTMYIKRIIGLPGETVEIKNGKIYIDGLVLNTDIYAKDGITEEGSPEFNNITLKENEYYCLGDNREVSEDSRYIGPVYLDRELFHSVALHEIIGKIRIRVFPFNKIKVF